MVRWELDLGVVEPLDCWSGAHAGCNLLHLHDLDRVGPSAVRGTHEIVSPGGGILSCQAPVLQVHAVGVAVGVIVQPDAQVLQPHGGLLKHLSTVDNSP